MVLDAWYNSYNCAFTSTLIGTLNLNRTGAGVRYRACVYAYHRTSDTRGMYSSRIARNTACVFVFAIIRCIAPECMSFRYNTAIRLNVCAVYRCAFSMRVPAHIELYKPT